MGIEKTQTKWYMGPYKTRGARSKQLTDWRGRQWRVELRDFREFNQLQNLAHKKVEMEVDCGKRAQRER